MSKRGGSGEKKGDWLKIELFAPAAMIDALTNFLTEIGAEGVYQEFPESPSANGSAEPPRAPLTTLLPLDDPLEERLAALRTYLDSLLEIFPELEKPTFRMEVIRDPGWGEAWKKYFKPLRVGRNIIIKPTWEQFSPTGRDIVIEIDPARAFGTGQHASTRMCLEAVEEILLTDKSFEPWNVLDVGTGTGILGIACAKLGAERVLGIDIDREAATIARHNVLINGVENRVRIDTRNIVALAESFSLIVANLTAAILIDLHAPLVHFTGPGGYLVISGIIEQDRPAIETRFLGNSLSLHRLITEKEWVCYVLRKEVRRQ